MFNKLYIKPVTDGINMKVFVDLNFNRIKRNFLFDKIATILDNFLHGT